MLFLLPLFLQELRGLSALESGLTTFPQALGMMLDGAGRRRLYPRVGPRRLMVVGMLGVALTSRAVPAGRPGHQPLVDPRGIMFLRGLALRPRIMPLQAATFATITAAGHGRASSLFSTNRQVASSSAWRCSPPCSSRGRRVPIFIRRAAAARPGRPRGRRCGSQYAFAAAADSARRDRRRVSIHDEDVLAAHLRPRRTTLCKRSRA